MVDWLPAWSTSWVYLLLCAWVEWAITPLQSRRNCCQTWEPLLCSMWSLTNSTAPRSTIPKCELRELSFPIHSVHPLPCLPWCQVIVNLLENVGGGWQLCLKDVFHLFSIAWRVAASVTCLRGVQMSLEFSAKLLLSVDGKSIEAVLPFRFICKGRSPTKIHKREKILKKQVNKGNSHSMRMHQPKVWPTMVAAANDALSSYLHSECCCRHLPATIVLWDLDLQGLDLLSWGRFLGGSRAWVKLALTLWNLLTQIIHTRRKENKCLICHEKHWGHSLLYLYGLFYAMLFCPCTISLLYHALLPFFCCSHNLSSACTLPATIYLAAQGRWEIKC